MLGWITENVVGRRLKLNCQCLPKEFGLPSVDIKELLMVYLEIQHYKLEGGGKSVI